MENKEFENELIPEMEQDELKIDTPKYIEKSSLNISDERISLIMYKPKKTLLIAAVFSVLFVLMGQLLTFILGAFIFALALFVQLVVKDMPTLEIYPEYVLVYKLDSDSLVRKVMHDDIDEWTSLNNEGKASCVFFQLKTGEKIYKDTFQSAKAYREFKKLMPEKESRAVAHQRMIEKNKKMKMKFKFKLPFKWPFGNKK